MTTIAKKKEGGKRAVQKGRNEKSAQRIWGYAFVAPALIILCVFMLLPILQIFYYSLTNWKGGLKSDFIGLKNYIDIFKNQDFYTVLKNNMVILLLCVTDWTILQLLIAMIIY